MLSDPLLFKRVVRRLRDSREIAPHDGSARPLAQSAPSPEYTAFAANAPHPTIRQAMPCPCCVISPSLDPQGPKHFVFYRMLNYSLSLGSALA